MRVADHRFGRLRVKDDRHVMYFILSFGQSPPRANGSELQELATPILFSLVHWLRWWSLGYWVSRLWTAVEGLGPILLGHRGFCEISCRVSFSPRPGPQCTTRHWCTRLCMQVSDQMASSHSLGKIADLAPSTH